MLITGWVSGVTPSVLLVRAVFAAVFFAVVTWCVFTFIIKGILVPPVQNQVTEKQPEAGDQPVRGAKVDITLPAEEPDIQETAFKPLAPQQIDPQLNRIIGEDPERVASLVQKMGLKQ
jgi:flagellar biosynthesis/type III secretory pathway M-ring protein FliF/YscJ